MGWFWLCVVSVPRPLAPGAGTASSTAAYPLSVGFGLCRALVSLGKLLCHQEPEAPPGGVVAGRRCCVQGRDSEAVGHQLGWWSALTW